MKSLFLSFFAVISASSAFAAEQNIRTPKTAYVVPYIGWFDIFKDEGAAQIGVEYRAKPALLELRPTYGVNVTTDGSFYGYAGVNWDVPVMSKSIYITPNFAVGGYHKGDGKKLGGPIEFRSGIEVSYVLPNKARAGVAFNHVSNASFYDKNPGAETLLFNYHHPINW